MKKYEKMIEENVDEALVNDPETSGLKKRYKMDARKTYL